MKPLGVNEQAFKDFIAESEAEALTVEWVYWMLGVISDANRNGVKLNPAWLRANGKMVMVGGIEDDEPPMIYA